MIESIVSGKGMAEDHNRNRKKQRSCVQKVGDVSALYYPEETGDSTRPAQQVDAIEDLWDTLVGVHSQLSHGGRQRMEKYLIEHGTHVPRPVIQLFLDLCQTCQETRAHTQDYTQANHPRHRWATRGRLTWWICRWYQMADTNISSTTRTASASSSSCERSRPRQRLRWQTAW